MDYESNQGSNVTRKKKCMGLVQQLKKDYKKPNFANVVLNPPRRRSAAANPHHADTIISFFPTNYVAPTLNNDYDDDASLNA